jgi:hypothetical protein
MEIKDMKLRISYYHISELSNVGTLHKPKLYSRSRTSEKFFFVSVYHAYTVTNDTILMYIDEV